MTYKTPLLSKNMCLYPPSSECICSQQFRCNMFTSKQHMLLETSHPCTNPYTFHSTIWFSSIISACPSIIYFHQIKNMLSATLDFCPLQVSSCTPRYLPQIAGQGKFCFNFIEIYQSITESFQLAIRSPFQMWVRFDHFRV